MPNNTVRPFTPADIPFALAQTVREGWDATADLFHVTLTLEPDGAYVAEAEGQPVGLVTTLRHERTAWIGNLIVVPECRGRGIGAMLMERAMEFQTGRGVCTLRLEADPAGIPLYRRLRFVDEFESPRFFRPAGDSALGDPTDLAGVEPLTPADMPAVARFDAALFGEDRSRLLAALLLRTGGAWQVGSGSAIRGYLLTQSSTLGIRAGPCVAEDAGTAEVLLRTAMRSNAGRGIITAVPEGNAAGMELLTSLGFIRRRPCYRMRWGEATAPGDVGRIFAIANGAMG